MVVGGVGDVERLGRLTEAEEIERDAAIVGADAVDDGAPVGGVGVDAVKEDEYGPGSFVVSDGQAQGGRVGHAMLLGRLAGDSGGSGSTRQPSALGSSATPKADRKTSVTCSVVP